MAKASSNQSGDIASLADRKSRGMLGELWDFLRHNKKWWLIPVVTALLLLGILVVLGGTGAAPFIYTLF